MIISLLFCWFAFPAAFSAGIANPFDRFKESGFIQHRFLVYLPAYERLKFMLTSREYYQFLEIEYDQLLHIVDNPQSSYKNANKALKADIRKLWRFFHLETEHRNSNEAFSIETLYKMIDGAFFDSQFIIPAIVNDNTETFNSILITTNIYPGYERLAFDSIHFPEISFILLKTNPETRFFDLLLETAGAAPFLYNGFFKYLALKVLRVPRRELVNKLQEYSSILDEDTSIFLRQYEIIIENAFVYFAIESHLILFFYYGILYQYLRENMDISMLAIFTIFLWVIAAKAVEAIYHARYENFAVYNHRALWRYLAVCKYMEYILKLLKYD